jgi:hypothetical protein
MTKLSSRRKFIYTASVTGAGFLLTSGKNYPASKPVLDHLLLGASSLEDGIAYVRWVISNTLKSSRPILRLH